jgi:hypothetical protein
MHTHTAAVSIGFSREDGDFEILATLNNTANHYEPALFALLAESTAATISRFLGRDVEILAREDAPASVCTDADCW